MWLRWKFNKDYSSCLHTGWIIALIVNIFSKYWNRTNKIFPYERFTCFVKLPVIEIIDKSNANSSINYTNKWRAIIEVIVLYAVHSICFLEFENDLLISYLVCFFSHLTSCVFFFLMNVAMKINALWSCQCRFISYNTRYLYVLRKEFKVEYKVVLCFVWNN